MCFLTNVNVLSPFHIALHTHTHTKHDIGYNSSSSLFFICYFSIFDFSIHFSLSVSFFLSISFPVLPLTATSPISLIVFSSFCHQLVCQRNKIYKFSLQSNIKAEVFFCCCLFFSYLSLTLSVVLWLFKHHRHSSVFDVLNGININGLQSIRWQ